MSQLNGCKCDWNVEAESLRKWLVSHMVKSALSKDQETSEAAIWNIHIFVAAGVPTGAVHGLQSDPSWYRDKRKDWRAMFVQ